MIRSGLIDLKNEIKKMSEDGKEIEKPDKIVNLVEKVLDFKKNISRRTRTKNINTRSYA